MVFINCNYLLKGTFSPTPKRDKGESWFKLDDYWNTLTISQTCMLVIWKVFSSCAASEASAERFFKLEKLIHSDLRSNLHKSLTKAVTTVYTNYPLAKDMEIEDVIEITE